MGEVVNIVVAFAVIVFIFRWITSGMLPRSCSGSQTANVGLQIMMQTELLQIPSASGLTTLPRIWCASLPFIRWPGSYEVIQIDTIANMFPDIPVYVLANKPSFRAHSIISEIIYDMIYSELEAWRRPRIKFWSEVFWMLYALLTSHSYLT